MWLWMTVELASQLRKIHMPFYVLTHSQEACSHLVLNSYGSVDQDECVVDSVLHHSSKALHEESVFNLWIKRYHAAALLARRGVSVTLLDSDTVIMRPEVFELLTDLEKKYALIVLGEGPMNGGMWHLRGAQTSVLTPSIWIIEQVYHRSVLFRQYQVHDHNVEPGLEMDQNEVGNALRVAAQPGASAYDFWEEFQHTQHPESELWIRFPQQQQPGFSWQITQETYTSPWYNVTAVDGLTSAALHSVPYKFARISVPFDDREYDENAVDELVLHAPDWVWTHGDQLTQGYQNQIAVYHLLGVNFFWSETGGGSHGGRISQWVVSPGMHSLRLVENKTFAQLSQPLVDASLFSVESLRIVVKALFQLAYHENHIPILPRWPCYKSLWLLKPHDHRVIRNFDDGTCTVAPGGWDSCIVNQHYVYAEQNPPPATLVISNISMHNTQTLRRQMRIRDACPDYFN
jgi:hypothetical protein